MIRFFAVVNYMVRTFSFCSNLYADVIANIILLHIFSFLSQGIHSHEQCESPISSDLKVMAKVKVLVHASHANADGRALTFSSPDVFVPAC